MEISVDIPEEELARLRRLVAPLAVGRGLDPDEYVRRLAAAAVQEYAETFGRSRAPTAMRDLRERRVALLARHLGGVPTEAEVGALFALTRTQARTLLSGARARYADEVGAAVRAAAADALEAAQSVGDDDVRVDLPGQTADYVRDLLANSAARPGPGPLRRDPEVVRAYRLDRRTRDLLREAIAAEAGS